MINLEAQIKCAKRELGMRINVYPKFVLSKRMKQIDADREIETMRAIVETLESISAERAAQVRV